MYIYLYKKVYKTGQFNYKTKIHYEHIKVNCFRVSAFLYVCAWVCACTLVTRIFYSNMKFVFYILCN